MVPQPSTAKLRQEGACDLMACPTMACVSVVSHWTMSLLAHDLFANQELHFDDGCISHPDLLQNNNVYYSCVNYSDVYVSNSKTQQPFSTCVMPEIGLFSTGSNPINSWSNTRKWPLFFIITILICNNFSEAFGPHFEGHWLICRSAWPHFIIPYRLFYHLRNRDWRWKTQSSHPLVYPQMLVPWLGLDWSENNSQDLKPQVSYGGCRNLAPLEIACCFLWYMLLESWNQEQNRIELSTQICDKGFLIRNNC